MQNFNKNKIQANHDREMGSATVSLMDVIYHYSFISTSSSIACNFDKS